MSNTPAQSTAPRAKVSARPVSLITIAFLFVLFAALGFLVRRFYKPANVAPYNASAENLTKELEWKATSKSRRAAYAELRDEQMKKETGYVWLDQQAGVVQLPIDRAMELTAQKYGAKK